MEKKDITFDEVIQLIATAWNTLSKQQQTLVASVFTGNSVDFDDALNVLHSCWETLTTEQQKTVATLITEWNRTV